MYIVIHTLYQQWVYTRHHTFEDLYIQQSITNITPTTKAIVMNKVMNSDPSIHAPFNNLTFTHTMGISAVE